MSPMGPASKRVQGYIDAFQLLTGYMVLPSLDIPKTIRVNPFMKMLEIQADLSDADVKVCLETVEAIVGDRLAAAFLALKLGRADTGPLPSVTT